MSKYEIYDWSQTDLSFLNAFEETMSCPICRELLVRAPKITDCGHTFCSECITRYMTQHNTCPVCRNSIHRGALRPNKKVEDLADLWIAKTRPSLWKEAIKQNSINAVTAIQDMSSSPGPSSRDGSTSEANPSSIPNSRSSPSTDIENHTEPSGLVQCPICEKSMTAQQLQTTHIDSCLAKSAQNGGDSPRKRPNRAVFGREYPQSKLSLPTMDAMTDMKLRNKLKDAGLSSKGNKARLKSRYTEWVTIYNASVDDKHPQSIQELRKRMAQWDKAQDSVQELVPNLKELDARIWSEQHKNEYAELIEQARNNKKRKTSSCETL